MTTNTVPGNVPITNTTATTNIAQSHNEAEKIVRSPQPSNVRKIQDIPFEKLIHMRLKPVIEKFDDEHYMENFYHTIIEKVERPLIKLILEKTRSNQLKASAILGINRNTLRKKINKLGIKL